MTESTATPAGTQPTDPQPTAPGLTGFRGGALRAVAPLSMLYLGLGVLQIFLAGYGVFDLHDAELGTKGETSFDAHRFVGSVLAVVALLIVIAVALARPGRRLVIMAVSLLVIVAVLQGVLASAGEDTALFGGLHALFGIGSLGLSSALLAGSRRRLGSGRGPVRG